MTESVAKQLAEQALDHAIAGQEVRMQVNIARELMRSCGEMIAERAGFDEATAAGAAVAYRKHHQMNRQGVPRGRGGR